MDLPSREEREEIIKIHLKKVKRKPEDFDCQRLAEISSGFSGAELAEGIQEALYQAYDEGREVETKHIEEAIRRTYPLSHTMKETIEKLRKWCKAKAVMASDTPPEAITPRDTDMPRLKQEGYDNPFI